MTEVHEVGALDRHTILYVQTGNYTLGQATGQVKAADVNTSFVERLAKDYGRNTLTVQLADIVGRRHASACYEVELGICAHDVAVEPKGRALQGAILANLGAEHILNTVTDILFKESS